MPSVSSSQRSPSDMLFDARAEERRDVFSTWITSWKGHKFYPLAPEKSLLMIEDIAHALSQTCRFSGHCPEFYSVAQHSVLVSEIVPKGFELWGLLHDASEAFLTDIPRPIKHLPQLAGYRTLEDRTSRAIYESYGLVGPEPGCVKDADALALRAEAKSFGMLTTEWHHYRLADIGVAVRPRTAKQSEQDFLRKYKRLRRPL